MIAGNSRRLPRIAATGISGALFLIGLLGQAQTRNDNWVFGSGVWLHLTPDQVFSMPIEDTVSQRNASISDPDGQFVLLADDFGIRNAQFEIVAGGTAAQLGWNVPAGNYLILPMPGHPGRYAVFINELPPDPRAGMVLVDTEANGGAGAVIGNGTHWYMDHATAKLTATTNAAETGYWVLQHQDNNDAFQAFRLTAGGLDPTPITSNVGTTYVPDTWPLDNMDRRGQMNFNFQGTMLGVVKLGNASLDTCKVELFQFDRNAGTLSWWAGLDAIDFTQGVIGLGTPTKMKELDFDTTGQYLLVGVPRNGPLSFNDPNWAEFDLWAAPPDSLGNQTVAWSGLGVPPTAAAFDRQYGFSFCVGPYGYKLGHPWYAPTPAVQYQVIAAQSVPTEGPGQLTTWEGPIMGGLPSPCKRYLNDSLWTGIRDPWKAEISIRPNPMLEQALLVLPLGRNPTTVVWRDALGRAVRTRAVASHGPWLTVERDGLPSGPYWLELYEAQERFGVVKVLCE